MDDNKVASPKVEEVEQVEEKEKQAPSVEQIME